MGRFRVLSGCGIAGTLALSVALIGILVMAAVPVDAQIKKGKRFSKKGECQECHEKSEVGGKKKHEPFEKNECLGCHKPTAWSMLCG